MIKRIVKMTFHPDKTGDFLRVFSENRKRIAAAEGCTHLELWNDISNPSVFFTFSIWKEEKYLEQYRMSELFNTVWGKTKILFAAKPEAWSVKVEGENQ
jgi:hypothetical protein